MTLTVNVTDANKVVHAVPIPHGFVPVKRGRIEYGDLHLNAAFLGQTGRVKWVALTRRDVDPNLRPEPKNIYGSARWFALLIRPEPAVRRLRLTVNQMRTLHAVSESLGEAQDSYQVYARLGKGENVPVDFCVASCLRRLAGRGFLAESRRGRSAVWTLGPMSDLLKEEGLLGGLSS